jgi:hypothetical protein
MKKIKITTDRKPWAAGSPAMIGDTVEVSDEEATILLQAGFAEEVSGSAKAPKRARNSKGQLQSDDPSTPDFNEAWADGKGPAKKRGRPKKK